MLSQKTIHTRSVTFKDQYVPSQTRLDTWDAIYGKHSHVGGCIACNAMIRVETFCCGFYVSKNKGGTSDIKNIIPLCQKCYDQLNGRGVIEIAPHITVSAYLNSIQQTAQQSFNQPMFTSWSNVNVKNSTNTGWNFVTPQPQNHQNNQSMYQTVQNSPNQNMGLLFCSNSHQTEQNRYNPQMQQSYQMQSQGAQICPWIFGTKPFDPDAMDTSP